MKSIYRFTLPTVSTKLMILLMAAVVLLPFTIYAQNPGSHAAIYTPSAVTNITLNPKNPGYRVSPAFLGFSIEISNACYTISLDQQKPEFAQLFKNLGPGNMRFGGTTVKYTTWSPNRTSSCVWHHTVVTKSLIDGIFTFARKVHWSVMWTVDLNNFDPAKFVDEAAYAVSSGASSLLSMEFGNEPDLYGISYTIFLSHWKAYYQAFRARAPKAPVSGPSLATSRWFSPFIHDVGARLALATAHWYIARGVGPKPPTIQDMLSPHTMDAAADRLGSDYHVAHSQHLPLQINETDNYSAQGQPGVSDVFASALWGIDYFMTALEQGVAGMNIHGVPNNPAGNSKGLLNYYSPINSDGTPAPIYYGLLLYHYAAANGHEIPVQITSPYNMAAHAVIGSDGKLRLVIINKDTVNAQTVNIDTTQSYTQAVAIRLLAPALHSRTGITLGGSAVGTDGTWKPTKFEQVTVNGPNSTVSVPAGSAIVITYS